MSAADRGRRACLKRRSNELDRIAAEITACELCPRLRDHCREVARVKRRAYREWDYWGKPVPGFGDPKARLFIIGLAPGAHGANRTGRIFTGDRSGDFLYSVLHEAGFASQPTSVSRDDGLTLQDCWISAAGRCAPPDNKPLPQELRNCRPYLERELAALDKVQAVVVLGRIAFAAYLAILRDQGSISRARSFVFGHNAVHAVGGGLPVLISSYHPSQQNTSTGRLTREMFLDVFVQAARILA